MENNNTFKVINDEGKEIVCDILFTFDSEETKKSYIVYTDNSKDEVKEEVIGDYDTNKPGTYKLSVNATDKSNNSNSVEFSLIVKEKKVEVVTPTKTETKVEEPKKEEPKVDID